MPLNMRWLVAAVCIAMLVAFGLSTDSLSDLWARGVYEVSLAQRGFHRDLVAALKSMQDDTWQVGFITLAGLSFLYGIFHAAGPGHGKAVLSAWLVSHPSLLRRAIAIATLSALAQGVTALVVIYGLFAFLGLLGLLSSDLVPLTERASYVLVIMVGAWLVWRAVGLLRPSPPHHHHDHSNHDHHHDHHHHDCSAPGHVHGPHCGHAHLPGPAELQTSSDWRSDAGMILAIGLRPCSGALVVLTLAKTLGWDWAGIAAVFAMSIGTAITTSALAAFAVLFRKVTLRLLAVDGGGRNAAVIEGLLRLAGGLVVLVLGIILLQGSFQAPHPLGL